MVRIALAQILYKPAIVDRSVDFLAEPAITVHDASTATLASTLSHKEADELELLRNKIRDEYVRYIRRKLMNICSQANTLYQPDIIVFPEYSVPYQCLPQIYQLSNDLGVTIIAGSHTVLDSAEEYYRQAGLPIDIVSDFLGCSVSPVFIPGSKPDYQVKNNRSNFEMSMRETEISGVKCFTSLTRSKEKIKFSVLICADALVPETLGKIPTDDGNGFMVFVTACSPRTETFHSTAQLLATNGIPTFVCNHSQYGDTGILLPESVRNRFNNAPGESSLLSKGEETLMLVELAQEHFYTKRAILDSTVLGSFYKCCILYGGNENWRKEYLEIITTIKECLKKQEIKDAMQWAEYFSDTYAKTLPLPLYNAFENFQRRLSDGGADPIQCSISLKAVILKMHATEAQFYSELQEVIQFCVRLAEMPLRLMGELGRLRKTYPEAPLISIEPVMPASIMDREPTEEQVSAFRDRGIFMTSLERATADKSVRLILISGAYGIGKSSAVSVTFKRNLINWDVDRFSLQGVRFATALEYLAELIGDSLQADTLTRQTKKILKPIMASFVKRLFAKKGRVIVVDQMETILREMQHKDLTLLNLFREAVCSLSGGEGKLIFISDIPFPKDIFPDASAIRRIVLGKIPDKQYITRILGYEMRRREMVAKGNEPDIPEYIYDLVNGHPLTAKLCIEVASRHGIHSLRDIPPDKLQKNVVDQLLEKVDLGTVQLQLMCLLSVFRTAVSTEILSKYLSDEHRTLLKEGRKELNKLPFLSTWEDRIELAAVFRRYYYDQIPEQLHDTYHEYALQYYSDLFSSLKQEHKFSGVIYTEIAYHLTCLKRLNELNAYLPGNINALKLMAKDIYQHENYTEALSLYQIMDTAYPDDPEILSYLGRCHARNDDWESANSYFEKAIDAAKKKDEETWYLYRDWGHMNIRSHMDSDATLHFEKARELLKREVGREDDAGILAAEGYALERSDDIWGAQDKYKAALSYNYYHEFTISRYAQLLRGRGDYDGAVELEKRLKVDPYEQTENENSIYPLDFEFIGLDEDKSDE